MVEQKCFQKVKETNCDIMMLVKRRLDKNMGDTGDQKDLGSKDKKDEYEMCRLMSIKINPWLEYSEQPHEADEDIVKQSIYIFNGDIGIIPTHDYEDTIITQNDENHRQYAQRFNNDKVQNC